ncbi:MAG: dTMP kinase [Treponema sp.]|nr:dTMP kinase [Treponema sp.]
MEIIQNFLVFEGGDGSGTTTQLSLLAERLKNFKKIKFFTTFEPTDSQTGKIIRSALKKEIDIKPQTLALLFAADRYEHIYGDGGILSHVNRGELVVSDRFVLSSLVYQGIECGDEFTGSLNRHFPAPGMTIFLDIDPKTAIERMKDRAELEIYEHLEFQEKVRIQYKTMLEKYREKGAVVEVLDASKSADEVADQVWSKIAGMPIFSV